MAGQNAMIDWQDASALTPEFIAAWRDLLRDSISPIVYLSPEFVLGAARTFVDTELHVVSMKSGQGLRALAVLQVKDCPLPVPARTLGLFKSKHSFHSGLLLSRDIPDSDLDAFLAELMRRAPCLHLSDFCLDTQLARRLFASADRLKLGRYEAKRYDRATLSSDITVEEWEAGIRAKKLKEFNRLWGRLNEQGEVSWRLVGPDEITAESVESFLKLEHGGWKGQEGDSLLSNPQEAEFFRQLVADLAEQDGVFFAEIVLDDAVVASSVNFKAGDKAYAFKVAWEQSLKKFSPGIMNEIEFIRHVAAHDVPFRYIDSGANADSYINALWPGRVTMYNGCLLRSGHLKAAAWVMTRARAAKRALDELRTEGVHKR